MHFFHPVFCRAEDLITTPLTNILSVPLISKYMTDNNNETELRQTDSNLWSSGSSLVMSMLLFFVPQTCLYFSNNI